MHVTAVPLVAIGASAGGIQALRALLPRLSPDWNLAYAIVLHRQAVADDQRLESLLGGWTALSVGPARDGEPILPGRAVVCPPDVHLAVEDHHYRFNTGPRENHSRPSVDVLFRSVAAALGERAIGIVLSGLLDDGAAGILALRKRGAVTIAQDPDEALHPGMPRGAIASGADLVATIAEIANVLERFARGERVLRRPVATNGSNRSSLTRFTCPDCHGVLAEVYEGGGMFFRCRVGHAFSTQTLHENKGSEIENALWAAAQILDEQVDLTERLARRAQHNGNDALAAKMEARAKRYRERGEIVRHALPNIDDAIENSGLRDAIV